MFVIDGIAGALEAAGQELGTSEWREISQSDIDDFARITGDDNWIHVDPDRASRGPYGGTIAHGYLTLALIPRLTRSVYRLQDVAVSVNYGCNKVRFPAPVPVGSRVRIRMTLAEVESTSASTAVAVFTTVMEVEGATKPCCVAENILHLRT